MPPTPQKKIAEMPASVTLLALLMQHKWPSRQMVKTASSECMYKKEKMRCQNSKQHVWPPKNARFVLSSLGYEWIQRAKSSSTVSRGHQSHLSENWSPWSMFNLKYGILVSLINRHPRQTGVMNGRQRKATRGNHKWLQLWLQHYAYVTSNLGQYFIFVAVCI